MALGEEERASLGDTLKELKMSNEVSYCRLRPSVIVSPRPAITSQCHHMHPRAPSAAPLQEVDKFQKAFKDPEFLKLFEEYAQEISDPKVCGWRPSSPSCRPH